MKKKVLGFALAAMVLSPLASLSATAQNNSDSDAAPRKEYVKGAKAERKDGRRHKVDLFEGITLTETQKDQLDRLDSKRKAARAEEKKQRKEQAKARKDEKRREHSARMAERKASKKAYLEEVKAILGPQNYVQFLENTYVNGGDGHKGGKHAKAKGKRKDGRSKDFRKDSRHAKMMKGHAMKGQTAKVNS